MTVVRWIPSKYQSATRRAVVDMFCAAEQMEKEMFTSLKMDFV